MIHTSTLQNMEKNKNNHTFNGIEKMIHIWYGDTDIDYKIDLFIKSKKQYLTKFSYYQKIGKSIKTSKYNALHDVYSKLYKISNIR